MNKFDWLFSKIILILAFLIPFFFLPITLNFYQWNKAFLLFYSVLGFFLIWTIKIFQEKKVSFRLASFDLPVLLLAAAYLASLILVAPNKIESLINEGGLIFCLTAFYFTLTNFAGRKKEKSYALIAAGAILSLIAIYQYVGISAEIVPWQWMQSKIWTPTGSSLNLIGFLVLVLAIAFPLARKTKDSLLRGGLFLISALIITSVILTISLIWPGQEFGVQLMPFKTGWQVAVDAFKFSPFLGTGPGSYLTSFSRYKPVDFNLTETWNILFANANNYYFHLLTTVGLLGLAAYLFLVWKVLRRGVRGVLPLIFLMQLILPGNFLQLFVLYLFLGLMAKKKKSVSFNLGKQTRWLVIAPVLLITAAGYFGSRAYTAEYYYKQSIDALIANRGKDTYDLQIRAIRTNPRLDYYHRAYAQTNLALAQSLSNQEQISDQDRNNIQVLIQQAIREAKIAANLNPQRSTNWNNLANIYRNLINMADGAGDWTFNSLRQAIIFEPTNPLLRIDLGSLFYSFELFDEAIDEFQRAVNLKPDHANAYYNLAFAYQAKEDWQRQALALQNVLQLVEPGSADYEKAQKEMEEATAKIPQPEEPVIISEEKTEELKEPEPLPSPMEPPIELPEESGPEITPRPEDDQPLAEPSPTPTP